MSNMNVSITFTDVEESQAAAILAMLNGVSKPVIERAASQEVEAGDEFEGMSRSALKRLVRDRCPSIKRVTDKYTDDDLRKLLRDAENPGEKEEEAAEEDDDEEVIEEGMDLDNLNRQELKALIKKNDLDIKVTSKMDDDEIRELITEKLSEVEEDTDDEEEEEGVDVHEGMKVKFKVGKVEHTGKIISIDYEESTLDIKSNKDKKLHTVDADDVEPA